MKNLFILLCLLGLSPASSANGEFLSYEVQGSHYQGYLTGQQAQAPMVLLIHDWDGLTEYEVRRAEMLASLGYTVFAIDLFGAGIRPTEVSDKKRHTGELYRDREKLRMLMTGALEIARDRGLNTHNAVAVGYCFGGAAVLELARSGLDLKGFVTLHGGLKTPAGQDYAMTKAPLLILHGSADSHISMDDFSSLAVELEHHGVAHEMISYGGAPHAFTVFGSPRYRESADRKSWQRLTQFLDSTLKAQE